MRNGASASEERGNVVGADGRDLCEGLKMCDLQLSVRKFIITILNSQE